jgi:transcriptional repressor NF-X1
MPCGEHYCGRPCHEGLCGACEVPITARCYCGEETKEIPCYERGEEKDSAKAQVKNDGHREVDRWIGLFDCGNLCEREYDCGKHQCEKRCHPQDEEVAHCPRSPDLVTHCPCGKTALEELSTKTRTSCEDEIPLCQKPCLKKLGCGHECRQICHTGDCAPCFEEVDVPCRCGRTTFQRKCFQRDIEQPLCTRICHANLNCGRHECGERCCSGERKAAERVATRKKLRSLHSLDEPEVEAEHICTRVCGRTLKCGNHTCQDLCHRGPCSTCREAIFEEISCNCGLTVLYPPLPCGTQPPSCRYTCSRPTECGHPAISHNCHLDDESCPKCPYHTTKSCLCGKNQLKNQPCWLNDVRCGEVCSKKLKCGYHTCRKTCHRPGECEDVNVACPQACGKSKSCGHPCSDPCHSPFPCKEDKQCQHKIFITCTCQRIKQESKCNATKATPGNTAKTLSCDDECLRLERNRKLQLALKIDPATHSDDHIPYKENTIEAYVAADHTWALAQEKAFRTFAVDPDQKRLRFKPMKNHQRAFLHMLAEDYGFDSESMDMEPHRHVALFKTPRFVAAPFKPLADCVRIIQRLRAQAGKAPPQVAATSERDGMNAFLVTNLKFGLTSEEIKAALTTALPSTHFDVLFLPATDEVLLTLSDFQQPVTEALLLSLKPTVTKSLAAEQIGSVVLCRVDENANVASRESESGGAAGWSRVAAKAAATPKRAPVVNPIVSKSSFVVLGSSAAGKKKKKQESVVDDWEMEEERLEKEEEVRET